MGVHGLWKLIEPSGQMVPLESLAGKKLAVDVSIWLHQAVKGVHDTHGAPVAIAHLLILFHRVCKLLFYKIRPVFVFDGGVPVLKRQTMAARRQRTTAAKNEALKVREKLIKNLLKHEAVRHMLSDEAASVALGLNSFTLPGPSVEEDLYKLPPIAADYVDSEGSEGVNSSEEDEESRIQDIHSIDVTSSDFLNLPAEVRHDILTELIETRKQSSWKYLDSMPKESDNFSDFQMNRLLKRHAVQTSLEKAGKEMGGRALSLKELESLLGDQGVLDPNVDLPSRRIAQDNLTHFMLVQKNEEKDSEEAKKFDIMKHLEDVEYSSESDTDVILQKSKQDVTKNDTQTSQKLQESNEKKVLLSKQPKVKITEEVADILSILEDKNASDDVKVKVENLQMKMNLGEKSDTKMNVDYIENILSSEKEEPSLPKIPEVVKIKEEVVIPPKIASEIISVKEEVMSPCKVPGEEICTEQEIVPSKSPVEETSLKEKINTSQTLSKDVVSIVSSELSDLEAMLTDDKSHTLTSPVKTKIIEDETKLSEKEANILPEITNLKETNEMRNLKLNEKEVDLVPTTNPSDIEGIEGSSESDNDFVDIVEESATEPQKTFGKEKAENFTVVINPTESSGNDDLFADVFESKNPGDDNDISESKKEKIDIFKELEIPTGNLADFHKSVEEERHDLLKEKGRQERLAQNMSDQVYNDAQELLRLFGIPYVVAPMEAEAQCAALNIIGLTEGTITDDSDIWLFGGRVVYKNFFNQQKHVLEYRSENIQKFFKLTREEMIKMAMLVGSDYTVGLTGIGPVTALEIIAAFKNQGLFESLQKFRDWFTGASKEGPPRVTLRKKIKNTVMTPGFPNKAVIEAYLYPQVDDSKEPFSWAKPNLDLIQDYARARLGWSSEKCNELLLPVLKKLEENISQSTIERHFKIVHKTDPTDALLSKRVETAIRRLGGDYVESDETIPEKKPRKKRKQTKSPTCGSSKNEGDVDEPHKATKKPRRRNGQAASQEDSEETSKSVVKPRVVKKPESIPEDEEMSKIKLINKKLHQDVKIPQKEMTLKLQEEKRKEAIKIFRTFKQGGKKKTKVYAKEEVKLSESSSDSD